MGWKNLLRESSTTVLSDATWFFLILLLCLTPLASAQNLSEVSSDSGGAIDSSSLNPDFYYVANTANQALSLESCLTGGCGCDENVGCGQSACDTCGGSGFLDKLLAVVQPSDHCFDRFISPISNPLFFEDPRTLTEARFIFVDHNIPGATLGGNAQYFALQVRVAVTDRLSIVANKDGYVRTNTDVLPDDEGWADIAAGLKYNVLWDLDTPSVWSVGAIYEITAGSRDILQGNGDGEFHLFLSGTRQLGCYTNWMTGTGFRLPVNTNKGSQMFYWSNHLDWEVAQGLFALIEVNWFHWLGSGDGTSYGTTGFEGFDLFNLGSSGVSGNNIVTGAVGARWQATERITLGAGFEFPLTARRDILDNRLYIDTIWRF